MTKQVPSTDTSPGWAVGIINDIKSQLRRSGFAIGLATIGVITGYIPVALLITLRGVDPELLTRDIFASTRTPIYTGCKQCKHPLTPGVNRLSRNLGLRRACTHLFTPVYMCVHT